MQEIPVRNFLGLNLRDSAEKVKDNEFVSLQNVYQPTKGILARRFGSVLDSAAASFPLCSRVSGVWRHYGRNGERTSLYHCVPDATLLPDNTVDLTLTDLNDGLGKIFGGAAVSTLRVCYSWIGRGLEQTYNSRNRVGYPANGSFPLDAWSNPAHQSITLGGNTHTLQVQVPAFPAGVTGANIFVSRGVGTQMAYMGTVTASAGTLLVRGFIADNAARDDTMTGTAVNPIYNASGNLPQGTYRVAFAWVVDSNKQEGIGFGPTRMYLRNAAWVTLSGNQNAIQVLAPTAASTFGATSAYVFVGSNLETLVPLTCVGIITEPAGFMTITSIPPHNAQSHPQGQDPETSVALFNNQVNSSSIGGINNDTQSKIQVRSGFIIAKNAGGSVREIFPSRTLWDVSVMMTATTIYAGDTFADTSLGYPTELHNYFPNPRTQNDRFKFASDGAWTQPYAYGRPAYDPVFTQQHGCSFMANGTDIPWITDGYTLGQITPAGAATQTLLPPPPRFIAVFQSSLVAFGAFNDNLLYMSNANSPQNWAVGGTGSALRFVPIGDGLGSGGTALGIFTPATEATSNPNSMLIGFKKNGTWMVATVPDPVANAIAAALAPQIGVAAYTGTPMNQVSGRVGCVAYRTVTQTPLGTLFLGQDANIYLIRAVQEPIRVGGKVQNALSHLVGNDTLMQLCTAVYHDNHFKLSYPSSGATTNDSELWADLRTEDQSPITWVGPHLGRAIGPQVVLVGDSDDASRLVADASAVRSFTADSITTYADLSPTNTAQAIAAKIKSKIFRFNSESHIKRILGAVLDMYLDFAFTNNVLFEGWADSYYQQVNRQLSVAGGVWDGSQFDQTFFADAEWMGFSFLFGPTNLIGRTFQWQVSSSDQAPFVLSSALMQLKAERRTIAQ